jgi:hypothetical protein
MLNGSVGVMKSMMVELTDETNMARGFSLVTATWAVGGTLGSDISHLSVNILAYDIGSVGPSLVVCWLGHKIVGQISSRILSGANIRTSCHVSPRPRILSCRFP